MASITKRGNTYRIRVSMGRSRDGKKLMETITYTPSATTPKAIEKEVRKYADEFEDRVKSGKYLSGEKLSFIDVEEVWKKDWAEDNLTVSVYEGYLDILRNRVHPYIGELKISKINALHIQNIYNKMKAEGRAPKTIKRTHTAINSVFRYAFRMGIIQENPCDRIELPKNKADTDLHYFTLEQSKRFLSALETGITVHHKEIIRKNGRKIPAHDEIMDIPFQYRVYFTLAIYSGARRGEMIGLTWKDIDFENKTIDINKAVAKVKGGQIIKSTKTVSGNRRMILPDECFSLLKEWRKEQQTLSIKLGTQWKGYRGRDFDNNSIFIQMDSGEMMYLDTPKGKFEHILTAYNNMISSDKTLSPEAKESMTLPVIRLHDLRHTSATLLLGYGVDIETVSHRMGHSKASITLDVYGHCLEEMDTKASETLGMLFAQNE